MIDERSSDYTGKYQVLEQSIHICLGCAAMGVEVSHAAVVVRRCVPEELCCTCALDVWSAMVPSKYKVLPWYLLHIVQELK